MAVFLFIFFSGNDSFDNIFAKYILEMQKLAKNSRLEILNESLERDLHLYNNIRLHIETAHSELNNGN